MTETTFEKQFAQHCKDFKPTAPANDYPISFTSDSGSFSFSPPRFAHTNHWVLSNLIRLNQPDPNNPFTPLTAGQILDLAVECENQADNALDQLQEEIEEAFRNLLAEMQY